MAGRTIRGSILALLLAALAAGCAPAEDTHPAPATPADRLTLGAILPETGPAAFLAPAMLAGLEMAVGEINQAGGVLGSPVEVLSGDEAGDVTVVGQTAARLLADGVDAVIGAAASGMSLAIIDQITRAEVVQCSPSSTASTLTDYPDEGYFFRTEVSDALKGPLLAEAILADGRSRVALIGKGDDYGVGLVDSTRAVLEEAGADVVARIIYDPDAASYDGEAEQAAAADPEAIGIVATDEAAQLLGSLLEVGFSADQFYGTAGLKSADLPALVDPANLGVLDGMWGTAPSPNKNAAFQQRFAAYAPDVELPLFADSTYDCVMVIALAATAAGSTAPRDFVHEMINVTRDGVPCTTYAACVGLLDRGADIDFEGASGPVDFSEAGEPSRGLFEIWQIRNGEFVHVRDVEIGPP